MDRRIESDADLLEDYEFWKLYGYVEESVDALQEMDWRQNESPTDRDGNMRLWYEIPIRFSQR